MGSERVCPHSITLYSFTGEDADGHALYRRTLLQGVHVHESQGVKGGENSDDYVRVHIFDDTVKASDGWTISPEGKDYFAIGDHTAPDGVLPTALPLFRIVTVARREMGSRRMWHWRIEAR